MCATWDMGHSDQLHIRSGILEDSYGQVYQMMHEHQASLKCRRAKVYLYVPAAEHIL